MNYYEHHIGDYDADTAHLTWAEDMAYTRLLRLYYRREKPIPNDIGEACRLVRAQTKEHRQAVESVLLEFFTMHEDGRHQTRCDAEIGAYQRKVEHNQRVGKLGGRPPKSITQTEPGPEPEQNPLGYFREPEQNPPQTPVPRPQTEDRGKGTARKRATPPPDRPDDVAEHTWTDWLQLRKGKHAAVTGTVLSEARNEAGKAGLTLERFLAVWCARGSQGLQADWLRPDERKPINGNHAEPDWRREQRERMQQAAPYAVVRSKNDQKTIDVEAKNAPARIPG